MGTKAPLPSIYVPLSQGSEEIDRHAQCALPVPRLRRDDPADTATWVLLIADEAGNEVHMQMRHGLPRRRAVVDADVVGGRLELRIELLLGGIQCGQECKALFCGQIEERADVPARDH